MPHDIDRLLSDAERSMRQLVRVAYEQGRVDGREQAQRELQAKLAQALGLGDKAPNVSLVSKAKAQAAKRAAPGTVKPAIRQLINDHPEGLTTEEITMLTGHKPNSIRGTLHSLREDGDILKRSNKWFPSKGEAPPDDSGDASDNGDVAERSIAPDSKSGEPPKLAGDRGSVGSNPTVSAPYSTGQEQPLRRKLLTTTHPQLPSLETG